MQNSLAMPTSSQPMTPLYTSAKGLPAAVISSVKLYSLAFDVA